MIQLRINLNRNIKISEKLSKHKSLRTHLLLCFDFFYVPFSDKLWIPINDDEILKIIKSEGPTSLQNYHIQARLEEWLKNEDLARNKLSALNESLLEYSSISPKKGRPKEEISKIDKGLLKEIYRDITSILNIAKKKRDGFKENKLNQL